MLSPFRTRPFPRPETFEAWRELSGDPWALSAVWEPFGPFFADRGLELFERCDDFSEAYRIPTTKGPRKLSPWVYAVYDETVTGGFETIIRD
jgi:hypothetical protein